MSERVWFADDTLMNHEPGDGRVYLGVIEWGSESGEDPAVSHLAITAEEIERWYVEVLIDNGGGDPDVIEDLGAPPAADVEHAEVVEWITAYRENATAGWLTIYQREVPLA